MAASYGFDISRPAENAKEAVQWLYFGYLAAHQGAERRRDEPRPHLHLPRHLLRARHRGRSDDRERGAGDHGPFRACKLRMVAPPAHARSTTSCSAATPCGSPRPSAACGEDGRHMVTKNSYRYPAHPIQPRRRARAQPHRAVERKPAGELFKRYVAKVSIDTDAHPV